MITSVGTLFSSEYKPESPLVAKQEGVFNDSNYSQAFSLEDVVMGGNSKEYMKEWRENNKEKIKTYQRKYREGNKEKRKKYREENKEEIKVTSKKWYEEHKEKSKAQRNSPALFATYAHQLLFVVEDPKEDDNGYLLTRCTYCYRYFHPTNQMVNTRSKSIKNYGNGNGKVGECRLYCSDGCKDACSIYHQRKYPKGFKPATSREVDPLIRKMCLARDNYTCQKCEKTIDEIELHAHHIEGATQMPMLSNDIDNVITFCKPCHKWIHMLNGCRYVDLRCK